MGAVAALGLVGAALLVVALVVAAVTAAAGRRWRRSLTAVTTAGLVVLLYAVALVGVSATTSARTLSTGEWKCFDEWCASLTSAVRTADPVEVTLAVQNRGRREQAPDSPRLWLVHGGLREEVSVPGLASRLPGGTTRHLPPIRLTIPAAEPTRLLITEGGLPSELVIGDDNSPFHPQPAWRLR